LYLTFCFNYVSYNRLTLLSRQFAMYVSSVSVAMSYQKALIYPQWKQTMDNEMDALISR